MKRQILKRIEEIRKLYPFTEGFGRWEYLDYNGTHISKLDFKKIPNEDLLKLFEAILRKYYQQW